MDFDANKQNVILSVQNLQFWPLNPKQCHLDFWRKGHDDIVQEAFLYTHRSSRLPSLVDEVDGSDGSQGGDRPVAPALDGVQVEGHGCSGLTRVTDGSNGEG